MPYLFIASDHAGFELKNNLVQWLSQQVEYQVIDLGPSTDQRVDYPDFADLLANRLKTQSSHTRGILICGSGQGMSIRANRYPFIRAGLVWNTTSATLARQHNDINVLCLGARLIEFQTAKELVTLFLKTSFEGGRHQLRIDKLNQI